MHIVVYDVREIACLRLLPLPPLRMGSERQVALDGLVEVLHDLLPFLVVLEHEDHLLGEVVAAFLHGFALIAIFYRVVVDGVFQLLDLGFEFAVFCFQLGVVGEEFVEALGYPVSVTGSSPCFLAAFFDERFAMLFLLEFGEGHTFFDLWT